MPPPLSPATPPDNAFEDELFGDEPLPDGGDGITDGGGAISLPTKGIDLSLPELDLVPSRQSVMSNFTSASFASRPSLHSFSSASKLKKAQKRLEEDLRDVRFAEGRYKLIKPLGAGSFADVYVGLDAKEDKCVAVKLERLDSRHPRLMHEAEIHKRLQQIPGVPRVYWVGTDADYNVMVTEMLGPCLEDVLQECNGRFSVSTALLVGEQMLTRIEACHSLSFLHRDLKPENFCVGLGDKSFVVHIVDFGLAKKYRNRAGSHFAFEDDQTFTGTARYGSINSHVGVKPSRRDDLEGLAHILIYFLRGRLPWQGLSADNHVERRQMIGDMKQATPIEELCDGLPQELADFLACARALGFDEDPDYARLRGLLRARTGRAGAEAAGYDWAKLPPEPEIRGALQEQLAAFELNELWRSSEQRRLEEEEERAAAQSRCSCFPLPRRRARKLPEVYSDHPAVGGPVN